MYSNHSQDKYDAFANDLKAKIVELIPELKVRLANGKKVNKVLINEFHQQCYNGTEWDMEIISRAKKGKLFNNVWTRYPTRRYAFEVFFMGIRLYSKIATRLWPSTSLVALKCARAWTDFSKGLDLQQYEYISKKQKALLEQLASSGNLASSYDNGSVVSMASRITTAAHGRRKKLNTVWSPVKQTPIMRPRTT